MSEGIGRLSADLARLDLASLARLHGLELSQFEADDLRPYYNELQRWLGVLRQVLDDGEEPATIFGVAQEVYGDF